MSDNDFYSDTDLEKYIETVQFLNQYGNKKMDATYAANILERRRAHYEEIAESNFVKRLVKNNPYYRP